MTEEMKKYCPVCKQGKNFIRVVEAHIRKEKPSQQNNPIGIPINLSQWVEKTELPMAYCIECNVVLYVGPSLEEVEKTCENQKKQKNQRKEASPLVATKLFH